METIISKFISDKIEPLKNALEEFKYKNEKEYMDLLNVMREKLLNEPFNQEQTEHLQESIESISVQVFKSYLSQIKENYYPCEFEEKDEKTDRIRVLKIHRWLTNASERDIDKLKNTYNVLSTSLCRFALIFNYTTQGCDVYMALYSTDKGNDPSIANSLASRFRQALQGNFPGAEIQSTIVNEKPITDISKTGITEKNAIAIVTNIATEKSEKFVSQGIEKLLDSYTPTEKTNEYTLVLLCEPVSSQEIENQRALISSYYTALSPYVAWQKNLTSSEAVSELENITKGKGNSIGGGVTIGNSFTPVQGNFNASATSLKQVSLGKNETASSSNGFTFSYTNHKVKTLLERLDEQMKRLNHCEALGMWRFAAYVLSDDYSVAENIAQIYRYIVFLPLFKQNGLTESLILSTARVPTTLSVA